MLAALLKAGFRETRRRGSHRFLVHQDGRTMLFAAHDAERIGPKHTLTSGDGDVLFKDIRLNVSVPLPWSGKISIREFASRIHRPVRYRRRAAPRPANTKTGTTPMTSPTAA